MVLFSRGAVRGLHVLMILVWFSRSSLAETTEAGTLGTQTTGAGTLGTQSTGVGTLGTQTTGVGTQETETVMSTVTDIVTMSMTTTASAPSGGETTTATTTAAAIITTTPTVAVPVTEAATTLAPPDPPDNVVATAISTTAFSVTWAHAGDNGTEFRVRYTSDGGESNSTKLGVESGVEVTGRTPGELYTVIVVAELNGLLAESDNTTVRLFPESVENLVEVDISPNSSYIQVQWDHPSGVVDGYRMDCSPGDLLEESLSKDDNSGTCVDITAGANVAVTVTSFVDSTVEGDPEFTVVTAYPNIVANLSILSRTSSSVSVQWDRPQGDLEDYMVECSGDVVPSNMTLPQSALNATCSDVTAGGNASVTVSTRSGNKQNPTSIPVKALPGKVIGLQESSATNNSVTVTWTLPSDHKNETYEYLADSSDVDVECTVASSNTEAECTNVTPGSLINVTVTTVNGDLNNTASTTARAYPYAVSDVTEGDPTTSSVSVSWGDPGGEVERYVVSCSSGDTNPAVITEGVDSQNFTCEGLSGGETVSITIYAVSGDKNTSALFKLTARPNQVVNLRELLVGIDFVQASWEKPDGIVTGYRITCSNGTASPHIVDEDGSSPYNASCEDVFLPGGDYNITVTPYSSNVSGESDSVQITAQPAAPVLSEVNSTVDSVSVSWNAPEGEVDYYRVECVNGTPEERNVTAGGDLIATCNVSTPGGSYQINVTSVSNRQYSKTSTLPVTALPQSVTLTEEEPTVTAVQASWQNPPGIVDRFEVTCSPGENATAENHTISFIDSFTTYTGKCNVKRPGDLYTMEVTSVSNEKRSASVRKDLRALPESVTLTKGESTVTTVQASWQRPPGIVDRFEVSCSPGENAAAEKRFINFSPSETIYVGQCNVTIPGDLYTMAVTSISDEERSATVTETLRALPEAVQIFDVDDYSTEDVTLIWEIKTQCKNDGCVWSSYSGTYAGKKVTDNGTFDAAEASTTTTIENLVPGNLYSFTIFVISGDERSSEETTSQRLIPESVKSLDVMNYSTDVVNLSWEIKSICESSCMWSGYHGNYTRSGEEAGTWTAAKDVNTQNVASLVPGGLYYFHIFVLSEEETSVGVTTSQRLKPEAAETFTVLDYTTNTVNLSWTLPAKCNIVGGCEWSIFSLFYGVNGQGETMNARSLASDTTSDVIGDLTPGESYDFIITVLSDDQYSEAVNVTQRTKPEAVENVTVLDYRTNTVNLSWTLPVKCSGGGCEWSSFNLSYGVTDQDEVNETRSLARDTMSDVIKDLIPGQSYDFDVTVLSDDQYSETVTLTQRTTPEAVENVTVLDYTTNTVNLSWTLPVKCSGGGCEWSSFSLSYGVTYQDEINETRPLARNITSDVIKDLIPGQSYDFDVTVLSDDQYSETITLTQRTTPEAVENVTVLDYTTNTVNLGWTLPVKCSGGGCEWSSFNLSYGVTDQDEVNERRSLARNITSDVIKDLIPGQSYNFDVTVLSDDQYSETVTLTQRTIPSDVGSLMGFETSDTIRVTWDKPAGVVDSYDTSIVDDGETVRSERVNETTVTFDDLTPGTNYSITVCSRSGDQTCVKDATTVIRTIPTAPSKPRGVKASSPGVDNITITFLNSEYPNGIIEYYEIVYSGTKDNSEDSGSVTEDAVDEEGGGDIPYSKVVDNLFPGFSYNFWVVAHNDHSEPSERSDPATESTTQTKSEISETEGISGSIPGVRDIKLTINQAVFNHCNGQILNYTVVVNGVQYIASQDYNSAPDYSDCGGGNSRKRRQTEEERIIVTIGDGTMSDAEYPNKKLTPNTPYTIVVKVGNAAGDSESAPYGPVFTEPVNPAAYVVPIVFLLLLIILLVGYIVWKERKNPGSVKNKIFRNGGVDNPGFITDKPMRRTGNARPVKLSGFALHLEDMSRDSDYLFSEEYNDLRPVGKNQADDAAKQDYNKVKNRFSNILPYDHTRVKLMPNDDDPGSDFINANYMIGARSNREYIACQGPLQNTEEDMWRMVWEQGASLIVMVTQLMEGSKIKCHQYWPQDGEGPVRYGDIIVLAHGTEHNELWVKRLFTMTKGPLSREIVHYNFTAWPDHGVPDSPDHLIKFVQAVRGSKKHDGKPVVVHCSAGVGRTGTFISLDTLMTQMESSDEVDIFGLVRKMRMNRCLMVQTEVQYIYIHQCVMALLEGSTDNTYENYNGNEDPYYNEALI